jgi:glycolate oxidase iron-sulfur subunit
MDGARALREQQRPAWRRWVARIRLDLLARPAWLRLTTLIAIAYRWLRLPKPIVRRVAARWPLAAVLDPLARSLRWPVSARRASSRAQCSDDRRKQLSPAQRLTDETQALDRGIAPTAPPTAQPALFRGCVARAVQQPTERALLRVLASVGHAAEVPADQVCCGAIHRHNGYPHAAERQLAQNRGSFGERAVVGFASACIAELREHGGLDATEICRYLVDLDWPRPVKLAPLPVTVAVHEPCSHRNLLRDQQSVYTLLRRIPELQVTELAGNDHCCGAAGTYLTEHPATALALAQPKIDALKTLQPAYLVTTNTGCALHLAARVQDAGLDTEVLHPVELIDRQLFLEP